MTTTPNTTVPDVPVPASFEDVVSAWDEPLRCQSVFGCRRRAAWLAIHHKPCGGQQLVCTFHHLLKTFWTGSRDEQYPDGTVIAIGIPPKAQRKPAVSGHGLQVRSCYRPCPDILDPHGPCCASP